MIIGFVMTIYISLILQIFDEAFLKIKKIVYVLLISIYSKVERLLFTVVIGSLFPIKYIRNNSNLNKIIVHLYVVEGGVCVHVCMCVYVMFTPEA